MPTDERRFELRRCLGRGSFGEVYAAMMRSPGGLDSLVAVKLLRADLDMGTDAMARLGDEGRILARLNHPAILRVFDLTRLDGRMALITELVEGEDLSTCIRTRPAIQARPLLQVVSQLASGLAVAATTAGPDGPLGLVHRDIKPSNIRIDRHGQAKLLDFGVARFDASDRQVRTASDLVVGSIPYMAPERFVEREVHPASDMFSLGCTLYEGLTGERFYGKSRTARITALALRTSEFETFRAERLSHLDAVRPLHNVLVSLLETDPYARPTAETVARALEEIADDHPGPTLRMWCRDREWKAATPLEGSLEGRSLVANAAPVPKPPVVPKTGGPTIQTTAKQTLRPGSDPQLGAPPLDLPDHLPSTEERPYTADALERAPHQATLIPPANQIETLLLPPDAPMPRPTPPPEPALDRRRGPWGLLLAGLFGFAMLALFLLILTLGLGFLLSS